MREWTKKDYKLLLEYLMGNDNKSESNSKEIK